MVEVVEVVEALWFVVVLALVAPGPPNCPKIAPWSGQPQNPAPEPAESCSGNRVEGGRSGDTVGYCGRQTQQTATPGVFAVAVRSWRL